MTVTFYRGESSQPVVLWCPACPFFTLPAGGGEAGLVLVIIFTAPFLCLPSATAPWWDTPFTSPWPQRVPSGHRPGQQGACLSSCTGKSPCLCFLSHICLNHIDWSTGFPRTGAAFGREYPPSARLGKQDRSLCDQRGRGDLCGSFNRPCSCWVMACGESSWLFILLLHSCTYLFLASPNSHAVRGWVPGVYRGVKGTLYKGLSRGVLAVRIPCSCIHWGAGLPDPLQLVLWLIICVIPFRFRALRPRVQLEGRLTLCGSFIQILFCSFRHSFFLVLLLIYPVLFFSRFLHMDSFLGNLFTK